MSKLAFRFSDNQAVEGRLLPVLDHVFAASPREGACQNRSEVCAGILSKETPDIIRTADVVERYCKLGKYRELFESQGAREDELGCFDITVDYDAGDPKALDLAVQMLALSLAEWAYHTGTTVAFAIHVAQAAAEGGLEPAHMHVLWDRRRGDKVYRDNVLQWYLHEQIKCAG